MKAKILVLCKANVTRSPIAKVIFDARLKERGLDGVCQVSTAGMKRAPQDISSFADWALNKAGYSCIDNHRPRQMTRKMVEESDITFTINTDIHASLSKGWANHPELVEKLKVLPHYGAVSNPPADDVFDPMYLLVSPNDEHSSSDSNFKTAVRTVMDLSRGRLTDFLVNTLTPYVPHTLDSKYREDITSLYSRTIQQLEPLIEVAIERMQREKYF